MLSLADLLLLALTSSQIAQVLSSVAKQEKFINMLPEETSMAIALHSKGNLRRALLALEASRAQDETFSKVYIDTIK